MLSAPCAHSREGRLGNGGRQANRQNCRIQDTSATTFESFILDNLLHTPGQLPGCMPLRADPRSKSQPGFQKKHDPLRWAIGRVSGSLRKRRLLACSLGASYSGCLFRCLLPRPGTRLRGSLLHYLTRGYNHRLCPCQLPPSAPIKAL